MPVTRFLLYFGRGLSLRYKILAYMYGVQSNGYGYCSLQQNIIVIYDERLAQPYSRLTNITHLILHETF